MQVSPGPELDIGCLTPKSLEHLTKHSCLTENVFSKTIANRRKLESKKYCKEYASIGFAIDRRPLPIIFVVNKATWNFQTKFKWVQSSYFP